MPRPALLGRSLPVQPGQQLSTSIVCATLQKSRTLARINVAEVVSALVCFKASQPDHGRKWSQEVA